MNWKSLFYPMFRGYPRVVILDRNHMDFYQDKDNRISFSGEAMSNLIVIYKDSLKEWSPKGKVPVKVSSTERVMVLKIIENELRQIGYSVEVE